MKLELRNVKVAAFASEETNCYEAALYVDGKKAAVVSNDGHGGPDRQHFTDRKVEDAVHAHFKSLPKIHAYGMDLDQTLELWCGEEVEVAQQVKSLKSRFKRKLMGVNKDGKLAAFKISLKDFNNMLLARQVAFIERNKDLRFLHDMSDAELEQMVRAELAKEA